MASYAAFIQETRYPLGYVKILRAKRIDAINRAILKTGKAWSGLELPSAIRHGYCFRASFDGMSIEIYKEV